MFSTGVSAYIRLTAMFRAASFGGQFALLVACRLYFLFFVIIFYFIWQIKSYVLFVDKRKRDFCLSHLHYKPTLGDFPSEYCHNVWY